MERVLQPYSGSGPTPFGPPGIRPTTVTSTGALPSKGTGDYVRAVRRRLWLVITIALVIIVPGAILIFRQANVYRATATIRIEPPSIDERVATIVPHAGVGQSSREAMDKYVPNRLAELRGRRLADKAATNPELHLPPEAVDEVVNTLLGSLTTRRHADSNTFDVYFDWTDRDRVALLLNTLLQEFKQTAQTESTLAIENSKQLARTNLAKLKDELASINSRIEKIVNESPNLTPDGKNQLMDQHVQLSSVLMQKRIKGEEILQQQRLGLLSPQGRLDHHNHPFQVQIDRLMELKETYSEKLEQIRRAAKDFNNDPAARHFARLLNKTLDEIDRLQNMPLEQEGDMLQMFLAHHNEDVVKLEREVRSIQERIRESMPVYQNFLNLLEQRAHLQESHAAMQERLDEFEFLAQTQNQPVEILQEAVVPLVPIRPKRTLSLAAVIILGLGVGVGLVCLQESLDRRIKVPEHLTQGLTLPLLGVIPRIRRMARIYRGGHFWTPGEPYSVEADSYRNLRASLLGVLGSNKSRPVVTLLITSAKAGEGKSTTALNLAATCARAGERTLLMEVDLRRPSLAPVFAPPHTQGLVDVLRGSVPWQRVVVGADPSIPNLDYLPCGDPGRVPIEALGTIEMRQLLAAVSGHYHRVILDGPAVLGLADCRTLGRMVDASVLVVRCGAHDLSPIQRAKAMLELSRVPIAGVVFNALAEDLANWSSHFAGTARLDETRLGQALPTPEEEALCPAVGA